MSSVLFSLSDYQNGLAAGLYAPPVALCPYYEVDPVLYKQHSATDSRRGDLRQALDELRQRTGPDYFRKTYPLQAKTLDYSSRAFPAYRFILPEVMTEDWLAIVDWEKFRKKRDHVLHQPLCGYVALKLLNEVQLPNNQTILDACVDRIMRWRETAYIRDFLLSCGMRENDPILISDGSIARTIWRIFFVEAAYVAAIFHDLGYPWQYAERLEGNLDGMNAPALRQNRSVEQIVQLFSHRLLFHSLQGYRAPDAACPSNWRSRMEQLTNVSLSKTHGLTGALGFLHLNDCLRLYPHKTQFPLHLLCIEWAAAAIMMHDMLKIYWGKGSTPEYPFLRLSFDQDPLSAVVTLVDVIQEFERPTVEYGVTNNNSGDMVTLKYDKACTSTKLEIDGHGNLALHFNMTSDEMRAIKHRALDRETREYFDPRHGYLDMSSLGIHGVQTFAC